MKFFLINFFCRLALYVYEYLLHVGAQKAAQTFLSEVSVFWKDFGIFHKNGKYKIPYTYRNIHSCVCCQ